MIWERGRHPPSQRPFGSIFLVICFHYKLLIGEGRYHKALNRGRTTGCTNVEVGGPLS